jgi:hypothetical protein
MRPSTRAFARTLAAVFASAIVSGTAAAQSSDPERPTLKIGPVEVRPKLVFTDIGVDNNVFNEREDPKSDFTFTAQPDLELAIRPGRFRISYLAGTQYVYYHDYKSERSTNRNFSGRVDADLSALKLYASTTYAHTSARPNAEIDIRARHHPRSWAGGGSVKLGYRSAIGFGVRRTDEEYDDDVFFRGSELATTLNNVTRIYDGSFDVALTELTTLSLVVSKEESRFDHTPLRNSDSIRIAPTLRFSPLGMITGSASFGYRDFTGVDPTLPDYKGFVMSGTLGLRLLDRFGVDSTFTRDVRYSYEQAVPYYLTTGGRATITTLLGGGIEVRATGGVESMDYRAFAGEAAPGRDRLFVYGAGGGLRIAERMRLLVEVEFVERTSARDPSREYENHRIFATLNWGASTR